MPKITKMIQIEITPEQFLNNCSSTELKELDLLIQSPRFQIRMNCKHGAVDSLYHRVTECRICGQINPKIQTDE